ncbi:unnamed protein product [Pleuronectes platessa]|uniref:Uncharacterized protein n=1 Tax=Pleuronectes platessa TaxID=8262 RepID=A0A9N7URV9_PLEPL|nr:unnamed protein product [Pleuronectes platessa]
MQNEKSPELSARSLLESTPHSSLVKCCKAKGKPANDDHKPAGNERAVPGCDAGTNGACHRAAAAGGEQHSPPGICCRRRAPEGKTTAVAAPSPAFTSRRDPAATRTRTGGVKETELENYLRVWRFASRVPVLSAPRLAPPVSGLSGARSSAHPKSCGCSLRLAAALTSPPLLRAPLSRDDASPPDEVVSREEGEEERICSMEGWRRGEERRERERERGKRGEERR